MEIFREAIFERKFEPVCCLLTDGINRMDNLIEILNSITSAGIWHKYCWKARADSETVTKRLTFHMFQTITALYRRFMDYTSELVMLRVFCSECESSSSFSTKFMNDKKQQLVFLEKILPLVTQLIFDELHK